MTSADVVGDVSRWWTMMLANDVAVMTSPRADVSKCKSGTCKRVEAREEGCQHVECVSLDAEYLGGV